MNTYLTWDIRTDRSCMLVLPILVAMMYMNLRVKHSNRSTYQQRWS